MQFPALLADVGDAESGDRLSGDLDRLDSGEGKVLGVEPGRIRHHLFQRGASVRSPDTDGDEFFRDIGDGDVEATILGDALHVVEVARAGIGAVDEAAAVGHAEDGEVGAHHALVVEEVGVDALADVVVAADLGRAQPFEQFDMVRSGDVHHVEVRQVDDAAILAHRQMLGIGDAPEMAVIPFVLAHWDAVAVFFQQVLVGLVAMRTLPAAEFHEIAAEFLLALVKGRALDVATGGVGFARVDGREIDLLRRLVGAPLDEFFFKLVRIEARIVDSVVIDLRATVRHPVGDQLAVAGAVLDPDGDAVPQAPHLLALAAGRTAGGGDLQQAVEGMALVVAEFAEDRRQFHGPLQRLHDLFHVEVALRRRQPCLVLLENVARMAETRLVGLVIAPLDLAALGGLRVAGVAHIGGVALVAQQRIADLLAGAGEFIERAEESQRMVDRHYRQILADHFGDQPAPDAGADDDIVSHDGAAMGDDALDVAVLDDQRGRGRVGEGPELAGLLGRVDQLAGNRLRTRNDEAGVGIEHAAHDLVFLDQREERLDLSRCDETGTRAEGFGRADLALDLLHPGRVAGAGDFEPADTGVMAHLLVEIDRILGRPDRHVIVAGRVAEVRGVRGRADIGRDAGLVDADDVVPAALDQMMGDGGADDAAHADDDNLRLVWKLCHRACSECSHAFGRASSTVPFGAHYAEGGAGASACLRHGRPAARRRPQTKRPGSARPSLLVTTPLFDRADAVGDGHRFGTAQGFEIAVRQGDEATVGTELRGLAGSQREFGLAAAFRHHQRPGLLVIVDGGGRECGLTRGQNHQNGNSRFQHINPGVATAPASACRPIYRRLKLNRN